MKYIFRAWYKDEPYKFIQEIINDELFFLMKDTYVYRYPFYIPFVDSDWTVEQFTGIYDSTTWKELAEKERDEWVQSGHMSNEWKGRMIFEGDIVKCNALTTEENVVVQYTQSLKMVPVQLHWPSIYKGATIKIIGNIHENLELLEE